LHIRLLTTEDAIDYRSRRLEALERQPEAFSSSVEEHRQLSLDDVKSRLSAEVTNSFVIGAFADGVLVGTAGFYRERGPKLRHKGHVVGVYVTAPSRGLGVSCRHSCAAPPPLMASISF
jgi:hypothetical protein